MKYILLIIASSFLVSCADVPDAFDLAIDSVCVAHAKQVAAQKEAGK